MAKAPTSETIMATADMKAVLAVSKREPVQAAIGLTADGEGLILLDKKAKPRKVMGLLRAAATKAKIQLNPASLRFGRAEVDADYDPAMVRFFINKDAPGMMRVKLIEVVKRAAYQKVEINIDPTLDEEADGEDEVAPGEAHPIAAVPEPPPAPDTPAPQAPDPAIAALRAELAKLIPLIGRVATVNATAAEALKGLAGQINTAIKAADLAAGTTALDQLKDGIKHALSPATPSTTSQPPPAPTPQQPQGQSLVAMQKSRLAWDSLRKSLQSQLTGLEKAIIDGVRAHNADEAAEDEFDEAATATAVGQLHRLLDGLDTRLIDKLDEALNAEGPRRAELHAEAVGIVHEYQSFVAGNGTIATIDTNGFLPTAIRPAVEKTLTVLAQSL